VHLGGAPDHYTVVRLSERRAAVSRSVQDERDASERSKAAAEDSVRSGVREVEQLRARLETEAARHRAAEATRSALSDEIAQLRAAAQQAATEAA
jgi:hypothetical protein